MQRSRSAVWTFALALSAGLLVALGSRGDAPGTPAARVGLRDVTLLSLSESDGAETPSARAVRANRALEVAVREAEPPAIRIVSEAERLVLYLGNTRFLSLSEADARSVQAASLRALAENTATRTRTVLESERRRAALANGVFSFSLVVSFGLIALFLGKRLGYLATNARRVLETQPERVPSLTLRSFEVLSPAVLRSILLIVVTMARWLFTVGLLYVWLIASLSLFDATRGYTERLTSAIVSPFSDLIKRVASGLPVLVITLFALLVLALALRVSTLFFGSLARGEGHAFGIPREHAGPANVIVHAVVVFITIVFGAPLLSGDPDGTLAAMSSSTLLFSTLLLTPLAVSVLLGVVWTLGGALKLGARVRYAAHEGRITRIGLTHTELSTESGARVLMPHLASLLAPIQHLGPIPLEVTLERTAEPRAVLAKLSAELSSRAPKIVVRGIDASGIRLQITTSNASPSLDDLSELLIETHAAIERAGLSLAQVSASS